jgi:molybdopterin-guanine dinucleotide biosynthesis protein A
MAQPISILRPAVRFPPTLGVIVAAGPSPAWTSAALLRIGGETILDRIRTRLGPHCAGLVIATDADPVLFAECGLPIVPVAEPADLFGGVLAALDWMTSRIPALDWAASVPADAPFLPDDLLGRLHAAQQATDAALVCASAGSRLIPEVALWPVGGRHELRQALMAAGDGAVHALAARARFVEWPTKTFDPFFRVRELDDVVAAESIAATLGRI